MKRSLLIATLIAITTAGFTVAQAAEVSPPDGFAALFNGNDLEGWWGLGTTNYKSYRGLSAEDLEKKMEATRADIHKHWRVEDGVLVNDGKGLYLSTNKFYANFELLVDYKTVAKADSGIYLRGVPQVQIWDYTKEGGKWKIGADKGSGGLWNNPKGSAGKDPSELADKPFGEWNSFRIKIIGDYVNVTLNGKHIVQDAKMSNYFDRKNPMPVDGPIQLQTHGGAISWKNVYLREIGEKEAADYLKGF